MSSSPCEEEDCKENSLMFEHMLQSQQLFLEELLKLGVSQEAQARIEAQLEVIEETLGAK